MTDVILVAVIVAFFLAAAQLVRVMDRVVADGADGDAPEEEPSGHELEPGRPA
jgi:hypothetical protein